MTAGMLLSGCCHRPGNETNTQGNLSNPAIGFSFRGVLSCPPIPFTDDAERTVCESARAAACRGATNLATTVKH